MRITAKCARCAWLVSMTLLLASGSAAAGPLEWLLADSSCVLPTEALKVPCGSFGTFVFGSGVRTSCLTAPGNTETIKIYPRPAPMQEPDMQTPFEQMIPNSQVFLDGLSNAAARETRDESVPCANGSCLSPPGGESGQEQWIPIIDWNDWHGWTTAWTVNQLSNLPVHLLPLDDPSFSDALGSSVGDAHVVAALCGVMEAVAAPNLTPAPPIINMSFGRLPDASEADSGDVCDPEILTCQLRRLLDFFESEGSLPVASGGNHGLTLFPASYESVLSVGSLDLAAFRWNGELIPSWESPQDVSALMPSSGLCLENFPDPDAPDDMTLWPAPAGSSYSSALLSGWLAPILLEGRVADPLEHLWAPKWSHQASCYQLGDDLLQRCNAEANAVLGRIQGKVPNNCWSQEIQEPSLPVLQAGEPFTGIPSWLQSLDQWIESSHNPAPQSQFCVPCVTSGGDYLVGRGPGASLGNIASAAVDSQPQAHTELVLDLSASTVGTGPTYLLQALLLRVDELFYPLLLRGREPVSQLESLASGNYKSLILPSSLGLFRQDRQSSLVYVFCMAGGAPEDCFWTSTPILLYVPVGGGDDAPLPPPPHLPAGG